MTGSPGQIKIGAMTMRQFLLGLQGLWPGRRWQGKDGAAQAIRSAQALQWDPVTVLAPSADLALWGRVANYQPQHLDELLFKDHAFFPHGGCVYLYPMEDLPLHRVAMERDKGPNRYSEMFKDDPDLPQRVLEHIKQNGEQGSRAMPGNAVNAYRSSKDSGVAMYYLWRTGQLMISRRQARDKVYDLAERVAPPHLLAPAEPEAAGRQLTLKEIRMLGLASARQIRMSLQTHHARPHTLPQAQSAISAWLKDGTLQAVQVEGWKETQYVCAEDLPALMALVAGALPDGWQPLGPTTQERAIFLSPLEYLSARGRAKPLFGFDYIWEIYKPAHIRKYGPYTMPILVGDHLVGRMDARLDRAAGTLEVNGRWWEPGIEADANLERAYQAGLEDLAAFLGADKIRQPA